MANELDVELEQYDEVVGNLNFSKLTGSRSAFPYQRSSFTFQEPIQQVETISLCATTYPRPGPADSNALIPQVPWIPGSCHTSRQHHTSAAGNFCHLRLVSITKSYQAFKAKVKNLDCKDKAKELMHQGQGQGFGPQGQSQTPRTNVTAQNV